MTEQEEKDALVALVSPWLPDAVVDALSIQESCGCYSEWTTEPPEYHVTFKAPRPTDESDRKLADVVRVLEGPVMQFALQHHEFTGCSCCCGDGDDAVDTSNVRPSLWVRIIPAPASSGLGGTPMSDDKAAELLKRAKLVVAECHASGSPWCTECGIGLGGHTATCSQCTLLGAASAPAETRPPRLLEQFARQILDTFEQSEAAGYRSRDRQFAIELLRKAFESGAAETRPPQEQTQAEVPLLRAALREVQHPSRTIIVATRVSERVLQTTYLNDLDADSPYIVTVTLDGGPPFRPAGGIAVPAVGKTTVQVNR